MDVFGGVGLCACIFGHVFYSSEVARILTDRRRVVGGIADLGVKLGVIGVNGGV